MELSRKEAETVLNALALAEYELETSHGLIVTDNPESGETWQIDNMEVIKVIGESILILEKLCDKGNACCS